MNTQQRLRQTLLALSCAAWLFSAVAHAQQSTPAPGGGGISIRDILGTGPSTGGGGGAQQCTAPTAGATCGGAGPASQGNTSGVNTGGGNPINLTNGNKYQMEVDLPALPGELGIEIVRHYNSAHRHVVGQLGMGWRLSYETDLYVVGQTVQILQADGARLVFNIDPQNPSLCAGADPAQGWVQILNHAQGGARGVKSYVWHWTHGENAGRQLRFDEGGKLVQIAAASGAVLSITRGPKGELLKVTDPQGRSLSFNHGGPGRVRQAEQAQQQQQQQQQASSAANGTTQGSGGLVSNATGLAVFTGIQSIDSPVGRFTYTHGVAPSGASSATASASTSASATSAQAQALARAQAANLTAVSLPTHLDSSQSAHAFANRPLSSSGLRRQYHFEDPRHPLALTGVSVLGSGSDGQVVSQRLSTFVYNERAQATLSVRGEPARLQTDEGTGQPLVPARLVPGTGVEQVHVQILRPALQGIHNKPGQTLLSNSLGQQTLYTHQIIGGQYRLVQAVGAGCSQCGPVNQRWGYDSLGRLNEQTTLSPVIVKDGQPQGTPQPLLSTRHTLDTQGRTQRIEQIIYINGKAQAPRLIERHEYLDARRPDKPTLIARPSVVSGLEQQIALSYNEAGQVTQLLETGYSPLDVNGQVIGGQPASTPAQASKIERSTTYTHTRINGRSLLTQIDGPLLNGPKASPEDSDITRLQWDDKGRFVQAVHTPGGLRNDVTHDPASGQVQRVVNDAGYATSFTFDARQLLVRISSQGPGWAQAQVQSFQYDALGHRVQSFQGDAIAAEKAGSSAPARPTERQAFDAQGRLLWHASALGLLQTRQYDTEGQLLHSARLNATMAQTLSTSYDELGRPIGMTDNAGRSRSLRYGPEGLPTAYVDALGREHTTRNTAQPAAAPPGVALRPLQFIDDFGRNVLTQSPDSGSTRRGFDAADRLVAMTDAQGNTARYEHDPQGRILRQTVTDAKAQADTLTPTITTEWRYNARHLMEVIHPTQRERFEVDARGLRTARIVTLITAQGELSTPIVSVTRYEHDQTGQLVASTLPDGSRLVYARNGQNQVVALKRQTIQTPWLRWLGSDQVLASGFERDLVGLSGYTSGNGIEARYLRSASGDLARVVYRHTQPRAALQARHGPQGGGATLLMGRSTQETIERLLGITPAHAQAVVPPTPAGSAASASATSAADLPGALGSPTDPQALIDHRYLWSAGGHLLHSQQRAGSAAEQTQHSHAYNARGQLVASVQVSIPSHVGAPAQSSGGLSPVSLNETAQRQPPQEPAQEQAQEQAVWRYAYDASQRRVLSQQGVVSQSDISTATQRSQFQGASHRLNVGGLNSNDLASTYNANGQPERVGSREYVWDALGRLVEVREETRPVARYQYDHRGLRIGKQVGQQTTHTLYDESRQPLAELDAQGRITRQTIWLADLPLAVIDSAQGQALAAEAPGLAQLWADVRSAINSWLGSEAGIAWLHTNHLGAPEAATNAQGLVIWRAVYAPFGAAVVLPPLPPGERAGVRGEPAPFFELHLRLPGQVWDEETGLHYNRQRYYDPELGQYLTPDPLGTPDGPNPYAYVAFNPLGFIDPDGLILFAFDGTGNERERSNTNVWLMTQVYDDNDPEINDGIPYYIDGPGTSSSGVAWLDGAIGYSMSDRINEQLDNLDDYVRDRYNLDAQRRTISRADPVRITLDIIGFSRGAAAARDFANQVIQRQDRGHYRYRRGEASGRGAGDCVTINIRFMGLWDTVLAANASWLRRDFNMNIPAAVQYVAHAVAVNEHRSAFPLESIGRGPETTQRGSRIERGFVGAHADIGGGYAGTRGGDGGDLSDVALNWVYNQAELAGVRMADLNAAQRTVTSPIVHNERATWPFCAPVGGANTGGRPQDRRVNGLGGVQQRNAPIAGLTTSQAEERFVRWNANMSQNPECFQQSNQQGTVDMNAYRAWLDAEYGVRMQ